MTDLIDSLTDCYSLSWLQFASFLIELRRHLIRRASDEKNARFSSSSVARTRSFRNWRGDFCAETARGCSYDNSPETNFTACCLKQTATKN